MADDSNEVFNKWNRVTKKYRENYYEAFFKKCEREEAENCVEFDIKTGKFIYVKDVYKPEEPHEFGHKTSYNCKAGRKIVKQIRSKYFVTEAKTYRECENLGSTEDDYWEDTSEEVSDDDPEDIGSTVPERQNKNKGKNSEIYENSLTKILAAISLDEKIQICPLSRSRIKPENKGIEDVSMGGYESLVLQNDDRTQLPILEVNQVNALQAKVITDNAKKGPLGFGKRVLEEKDTIISLEFEKKYLKYDDGFKECFVKLTRFNEVSFDKKYFKRYDLKECSVNLPVLNGVSTDAKGQTVTSEKCAVVSKTSNSKKTKRKCIKTRSVEIIQIEEFNAEEKPQEKSFVRERKSSVRNTPRCCKSDCGVNNTRSLIITNQPITNRDFLQMSQNENHPYFASPLKTKRKSRHAEFDEGLPSPKRASNSITLCTENGNSPESILRLLF